MDENKEIEKLSETGGQSAEVVSGGVDRQIPHRPIRRPRPPKRPSHPPACLHAFGNCRDCGKRINKLCMFNGKAYCTSCWGKHANESLAPAETPTPSVEEGPSGESLSESDLLQVSGGTGPSTQGLNYDRLSHKPNCYHCQKCGKEFNFIEHEAVQCNGAPPFCAKCKAENRTNTPPDVELL